MTEQRPILRATALVGALAALSAVAPLVAIQTAAAQTAASQVATPQGAGGRPQALPRTTIDSFEADPRSLLRDYAPGGLPLSARVRALAVSDPNALPALIALAHDANDAQKAAIGAGLAEAAAILSHIDPAAATTIREQVAKSGLDILVTAFIAASEPTPQPIVEDLAAGVGGAPGALAEAEAPRVFAAPGTPSGFASQGFSNGGTVFGGGAVGGGGLSVFTQFSVSPSRNAP